MTTYRFSMTLSDRQQIAAEAAIKHYLAWAEEEVSKGAAPLRGRICPELNDVLQNSCSWSFTDRHFIAVDTAIEHYVAWCREKIAEGIKEPYDDYCLSLCDIRRGLMASANLNSSNTFGGPFSNDGN